MTDAHKKEFQWKLDFSVNLGEAHQRFFEGLEEKRILGVECPDCGNVFVPPQPHCDECFVATEDWRRMEPKAHLESYTVTFFKFRNMPDPPYVTGVIRVGDSATCLLHFVGGIKYDDPEDLLDAVHRGMELRPVWSDQREGDILDIEHFEPVLA